MELPENWTALGVECVKASSEKDESTFLLRLNGGHTTRARWAGIVKSLLVAESMQRVKGAEWTAEVAQVYFYSADKGVRYLWRLQLTHPTKKSVMAVEKALRSALVRDAPGGVGIGVEITSMPLAFSPGGTPKPGSTRGRHKEGEAAALVKAAGL